MITYSTDCTEINWIEAAEVVRKAPLGKRDPEKMRRAFMSSYTAVFAWDKKTLVGMGRAVCDGEYQAAIYDIVILPEYQRRGIGKRLIAEICSRLPVSNIILFAVPGKEAFYAKLGFRLMQTAMAKLEPRLADSTAGYLKVP